MINGVSVRVDQHVSGNTSRVSVLTAQFYVGSTAKTPSQALTSKSLTIVNNMFSVTQLPTLAKLQGGTCKVRVIFTRTADDIGVCALAGLG